MAKSNAVWGIDVGHCALKALRCLPHEKDPQRLVAEAFDYVEYPKILSQPEADRDELIRDALEQFLSRNDLTSDRVAISVPGQSGLARFIKLPPVEAKKIPDIVKYEARQQIPFALEDVVWDYQQLAGGSEDDGFALETEVGLFAMKKDQVANCLQPFEDAGIEVDLIQLAPLAIYNFICFDRLGNMEAGYDAENPPKSTVVIALGTDTTDLVITNGFRVWQRNIPIGGNHFTKALTKELRMTFANAEHLKRNATEAEDPKAVFQAMRPVFSDLLAEVQRSIGYFSSIDKSAELGDIVALGNGMKLPGLQRYLSQNLEQEVKAIDQFSQLAGGSVTAGPQFKENVLSFAVAYGLCAQALERGQLKTNLLPEEIVTSRLIREKKPWAVAGVALLLVGMTVNYMSHYSSWKSADTSAPDMSAAIEEAKRMKSKVDGFSSEHSSLQAEFTSMEEMGQQLVSNVEGRLKWLELLKALEAATPIDQRAEREESAGDVTQREEVHLTRIDCERFDDLSAWHTSVKHLLDEEEKERARTAQLAAEAAATAESDLVADVEADPATDDGTSPDGELPADAAAEGEQPASEDAPQPIPPPTGPGWVIEVAGHHFHNGSQYKDNQGARFVRRTLIQNLLDGSVELPDGEGGTMVEVTNKELGIGFPVIVESGTIFSETYDPEAEISDARRGLAAAKPPPPPANPRGVRGGDAAGRAAPPEEKAPETWELKRYDFIVQFIWQPKTRSERQNDKADENAAADGAKTAGL